MIVRFWLIAMMAGLLGLSSVGVTLSRPPEKEKEPASEGTLPEVSEEVLPETLEDRAFDRYIPGVELRETIMTGDADSLADAALQLAEAERVLRRSHKAIKASTVFKLAVQAASKARDKATLERLAKDAGPDHKTLIDTAMKIAATARATMPKLDGVSEEDAASIRAFTDAITTAERLQDREALTAFQKQLGEEKFPKAVTDHLAKEIKAAIEALPEKSDEEAEAAKKLAGPSRAWWDPVVGTSKWTVTIYHKASGYGNIQFTLGGTRFVLGPNRGGVYTGKCKGKVQIYFLIRSGNYRQYSLDSGKTYDFKRTSNGFDLYRR